MFLGEYFHSLDGKGRVVMPSGFRRGLDGGCVLTKGQDGQIVLFPVEEFRRRAEEVKAMPQDRSGRRRSRTVFPSADPQDLDKSGRVLVKPDLREFAGLEPASEIAVIGLYGHIELWNKEAYLADRIEGDARYLEDDA